MPNQVRVVEVSSDSDIKKFEIILPGPQGAPGATGPQGEPGIPGTDGQGISWLGAWQSDQNYAPYDAVHHLGSSYISTAESYGVAPGESTFIDDWQTGSLVDQEVLGFGLAVSTGGTMPIAVEMAFDHDITVKGIRLAWQANAGTVGVRFASQILPSITYLDSSPTIVAGPFYNNEVTETTFDTPYEFSQGQTVYLILIETDAGYMQVTAVDPITGFTGLTEAPVSYNDVDFGNVITNRTVWFQILEPVSAPSPWDPLALQDSTLTYTAQSSNYDVLLTDDVVGCSGTFTVTLYSAVTSGKQVIIKNLNTGTITIAAQSGETIDGSPSIPLTVQYESVTLVSTGTDWIIV